MNLFGLIAATGLPTWVTTSFPIIKGILVGYIALAAIAIIVLVLLQPSNSQGMTGITGETTDTYYSHNKSATKEGRMKKATAWIAVSVVIATILFFILSMIVA
ncbi:MAG: preprotein translocase subunit SecG [Clostridia bacterium]|nr:preprotein translocase subunit SecG [Clostridia bacterium]